MNPDNSVDNGAAPLRTFEQPSGTAPGVSRRAVLGTTAALFAGTAAGVIADQLGFFNRLFPSRPKTNANQITNLELENSMEYARRVQEGKQHIINAMIAVVGERQGFQPNRETVQIENDMQQALDAKGFELFTHYPVADKLAVFKDLTVTAGPYLTKLQSVPESQRLYYEFYPEVVASAFVIKYPIKNDAGRALEALDYLISGAEATTIRYLRQGDEVTGYSYKNPTADDQLGTDSLLQYGIAEGLRQNGIILELDSSQSASQQWIDAAHQLINIAVGNNNTVSTHNS